MGITTFAEGTYGVGFGFRMKTIEVRGCYECPFMGLVDHDVSNPRDKYYECSVDSTDDVDEEALSRSIWDRSASKPPTCPLRDCSVRVEGVEE